MVSRRLPLVVAVYTCTLASPDADVVAERGVPVKVTAKASTPIAMPDGGTKVRPDGG